LQAFRTNKKDRNALQRADKLVAGTENALFNLNLLGRHYIAALDIDNAVRVYELAYQMVPDDLATQRNYAQALATAGNMKEAEIVVGRILQKYPDDFIARQMQAVFDKRAQAKAENHQEKGG